MKAADLIRELELQPHPEGGYFRETYRSSEETAQASLPARFRGNRSHSTAIYFLLPQGSKSHLHRIASDEVWHFYLGGPLRIVEIQPDGSARETTLGQDLARGEKLQHVVRAGTWFGAYPAPGTEYSFVGCTVSPGFDFADFELADREEMLTLFPAAMNAIKSVT